MIDNRYFAEGMGCEPREETILEPYPNEAVVFEEFFNASLRMPPHHVLADIYGNFMYRYISSPLMPSFSCQNIFGQF
jgi:hypothetical protein